MKNNRGQALIEFVLILPVLLLLIFTLIDFGRIIVCKSHLEGVMNEVSSLSDEEIDNLYNKKKEEGLSKEEILNSFYTNIIINSFHQLFF